MKKNKKPKELQKTFSEREKQALDILNKLGQDSFDKKDYVTAIVYFKKYLAINPNNADICNTIGYLFREIGGKYQNFDPQIEYFEKAIAIDSNYKFALRNLALTYPFIGKYEEAINCFHKLFKLEPVQDDYLAYAYLQIQLKNFIEGWKYYEHRFLRLGNSIKYPQIDKPKWDGQKIPDKTLLVHYEQGFGDTLCFFRYLEQVKPFAKKIIFRVQNELFDLLKTNVENVEVVPMSTPLNEIFFDYHIPLMSLLHILQATVENIPSTKGYIKADKNKVEKFKKKYFDNDCFKIGIAWSGAQIGNKRRNIPLKCFYPLTKLNNVKVYSFQKGYGAEQLKDIPPDVEITNLSESFDDFSDTAAALENLDLFISSDNGVFNLAGAMGKKTFLMLNKYAEWRWSLDEETTHWYDSVRIFKKQDEDESWDVLIQMVIENLSQSL